MKYEHGGIVSLKEDAKRVRAAGIGGDTVLAHITPSEAALLKLMGGSGRINPRTGLPMFEDSEGGTSEGGTSEGGTSVGEATNDNSSNTSAADPGNPGDNQGSAIGDPSNDTQDTVGPNDPSPPDAAPPDSQDPDAPSPNAKEAAFLGGLLGLSFEAAPAVNATTPTPGSNVATALGNTEKAGFGTNISGFTSDVTPGSNTSTPFGGLNTDPSSTPGYAGSPSSGQLGALGSSFNSRSDLDASVPETTVTPETSVTPPEAKTQEPSKTDSNPADLGGDPGVSPSLGAEPGGPSLGDTSGPGGGERDDTVVPTTTADVVTTPVTPVITTPSPVKYDVSKFLSNLGEPTYTPTPSVYTSYPRVTVPQYSQPVTQFGIGQFYKPYFPLVPYQRRYP